MHIFIRILRVNFTALTTGNALEILTMCQLPFKVFYMK